MVRGRVGTNDRLEHIFIKDVLGPKGSVSIVVKNAGATGKSDLVDAYTKTESLRCRYAGLDENNEFVKKDQWIDLEDEQDHQELCNREQRFILKDIHEDIDLTDPLKDAIDNLRIAFACDESVRTGKIVELSI